MGWYKRQFTAAGLWMDLNNYRDRKLAFSTHGHIPVLLPCYQAATQSKFNSWPPEDHCQLFVRTITHFPKGTHCKMALELAGYWWFEFATSWGIGSERDLQISPVFYLAPPETTKVINLGPPLEKNIFYSILFIILYSVSSVQSLSRVLLFVTPWATAHQASLSFTNSQSLLNLMSIESVMPSNHLILCCPLLPPSILPSIRVFPNGLALHIRWPKYWSFSFNICLSNEHPELISFRMDWLDFLASKGLSRVFPYTTVQKHQFFSAQLSL